MLNSSILKISE